MLKKYHIIYHRISVKFTNMSQWWVPTISTLDIWGCYMLGVVIHGLFSWTFSAWFMDFLSVTTAEKNAPPLWSLVTIYYLCYPCWAVVNMIPIHISSLLRTANDLKRHITFINVTWCKICEKRDRKITLSVWNIIRVYWCWLSKAFIDVSRLSSLINVIWW